MATPSPQCAKVLLYRKYDLGDDADEIRNGHFSEKGQNMNGQKESSSKKSKMKMKKEVIALQISKTADMNKRCLRMMDA